MSFYFGRYASFVWVVPKEGPVAFESIASTAADIETKVRNLREALESPANLADYPPFDVGLAHDLYGLLLKPVEVAWKPAKEPDRRNKRRTRPAATSLLPTAQAEVNHDEGPLFAGYRRVPWLGRTHAVTIVPSSVALRAMRQLPPGSDKREPVRGVRRSLCSASSRQRPRPARKSRSRLPTSARARCRRRAVVKTRGIDTADLDRLPRLPDTADELKSIAAALRLEPSRVLHLGKDANEQTVKSSDLSRFRIIAFSTHGLMAGDLDGLTQPALALSAPAVADVDGDGLLTMEEILPLKLDADWVLLSACNTAAGAGDGRGGSLRARPRLLLCGQPFAACDQLGRGFGFGT